jgi:hypothetical protein
MIGLIPRQHTAHTLLGTLAWLAEDPETRKVRIKGVWPEQEYSYTEFRAWFRKRLDVKITGHLPSWRKLDPDWQRQTSNLARDVNTPRLVVSWCPSEFRAKLAHRLTP